ncbi:MAG: flagellar export chaperone FlgN [Thermoleophilaceae bacterium]|nr:flagellar export chaperone FlgN [Thermoleophilaceae bacterium]
MSAPQVAQSSPVGADAALARDVLAHLERQIESARRLLATILAQGAAIRERDVDSVIRRLAEMKTEMELRGALEAERTDLLVRAGEALGLPPAAVTLEGITSLMPEAEARTARERSAELRGLLDEIAREHGINRALMRQELAFLDHLVRLLGQESEGGYRPSGPAAPQGKHRVLNVQA